MTELTIITLIVLIILIGLYFFVNKIKHTLLWVVNILMIVFVAGVLSALFLPQLYYSIADQMLVQVGTFSVFTGVDSTLSSAVNSPQEFINQIASTLNIQVQAPGNEINLLQTQVYPGLVELVSTIIRVVVIGVSGLGIILAAYLRFLSGDVNELNRLHKEHREMEERIRRLEAITGGSV